jgi:hypothetical protein
MKAALRLALLIVVAAACDRRDRLAAPDTSGIPTSPVAPDGSAYLTVSDLTPPVGASIVVAGTLRVGDSLSLGSYRVRLGFDSTRLHFLEDVTNPDMLRVVNPRADEVVIVGASTKASADGRLFALRFRVDDPAGVNSLVLRIDELNDGEFRNRKDLVMSASTLFVDRSLARLVPK